MKLKGMMSRWQKYVLSYRLAPIVIFMAYCGMQSAHQPDNIMDAKRALVAAIQYFPAKDYGTIDNYKITMDSDATAWKIFFVRIKPAEVPGGHFSIEVPKQKGEIKLIPGE